MVILGINGWTECSHDAAACLVVDGKIVAAVEEEKTKRQKRAYDCLPIHAINACLDLAGLNVNDIDRIFWGWDLPKVYARAGRRFDFNDNELNALLFPEPIHRRTRTIAVEFISHHLAHAVSAFVCSGFSEATVVVIDGQGESQSTSVWRGDLHGLHFVCEWPVELSLGYFFEAACLQAGFSQSQAGKLMGLAAYESEPHLVEFFDYLHGELKLKEPFYPSSSASVDDQAPLVRYWQEQFYHHWGEPNLPQCRFDRSTGRTVRSPEVFNSKWIGVAASVQAELERVYGWLVATAISLAGPTNVAMAGGVALNCSANGSLRAQKICKKLFVQPASHDAGCALGAALYGAGLSSLPGQFDPLLGPEYDEDLLHRVLKESKLPFRVPTDLSGEVAEAVCSGSIVGWFQGRGEFGPRALGARSILAHPGSRAIADAVNDVKGRERWRPLAPSITSKTAMNCFTPNVFAPHMLERVFVNCPQRDLLAGITHVDGSARPQVVSVQPLFESVLKNIGSGIGVEASINTSFNTEHEPIVYTPLDALHTFVERGFDSLAIGPFLVTKRR